MLSQFIYVEFIGLFTLDMRESSFIALDIVLRNFYFVLLGVVVGMIIGVIPGMGGIVTLSILIPFTLSMNPNEAFIILAASLGATSFSGALTAILVNVPGSAGNAATLLDGYPMTRDGRGSQAIGAAAVSSAGGAIIGLILFYALIPLVREVALLFGHSEIVWIALLGISIIPLVAGERILSGLLVAFIGLLFATVGQSPVTGAQRYSFGIPELYGGIGLIPAIVGLFAVAEMLRLVSEGSTIVSQDKIRKVSGSALDGVKSVFQRKSLWIRCSAIGTLVGAIPGVGASVATFVAYGHAVQSSDDPDSFGKGNIEGVIASESANDAKDGGQLFPTFGLGIPGSGSMAVLLGAFLLHGIEPGPRLLADHLELILIIVYALILSNILTSIIGVLFTDIIIKITKIPTTRLFPTLVILSLTAVFIVRNNYLDVIFALIFGGIGLILLLLNISRVPIIIALVLGPIIETNFYLAIQTSQQPAHIALTDGLLNILLILILVVSFTIPIYRNSPMSSTSLTKK